LKFDLRVTTISYMKRFSLLLVIFMPVLLFIFISPTVAEGTREIYPVGWGNYKFYLSHDNIRNDFALYGCPETERLNIEILTAG